MPHGPRPPLIPDSALAGLRPARPEAWLAPLYSLYEGLGDLAVRKAWPSLEGGIDVGKAWPGLRPPAQAPPPPALPACLTFALCSWAIETATAHSSGRSTSCRMKGPRSEAGRGWRRSRGVGRGLEDRTGRRGRQGGVRRRVLLSLFRPPNLHSTDGFKAKAHTHPSGIWRPTPKGRDPGIAPWWWPHHPAYPQWLTSPPLPSSPKTPPTCLLLETCKPVLWGLKTPKA